MPVFLWGLLTGGAALFAGVHILPRLVSNPVEEVSNRNFLAPALMGASAAFFIVAARGAK